MVDWGRTRVWSEGGYYARVFLNVEGREPEGQVPAADYEAFRDEVKAALEALGDENGESSVWVVDKETMTVQKRKVKTGDLAGKDAIEIVEGLKPGEVVAVAGVSRLSKGMKVRPYTP